LPLATGHKTSIIQKQDCSISLQRREASRPRQQGAGRTSRARPRQEEKEETQPERRVNKLFVSTAFNFHCDYYTITISYRYRIYVGYTAVVPY
jgi:hypothetical protein